MIAGGIYLFFFLEYVMKMIVRFKEKSLCDSQEEMVCFLLINIILHVRAGF